MYPFQEKETVPIWALVLIMAVLPVVLMFIVSIGIRKSPYDFHNGVLGLLLSVLLTTIFTQAIKVAVGKHRPDFLSRCVPMQNGAPLIHDQPLQLWTIDVCTQTDKYILKDGMRSFPSGHSSTAFAGLVYLALWMGGKMHVFDRKGYSLKPVIIFIPILGHLENAIGIRRNSGEFIDESGGGDGPVHQYDVRGYADGNAYVKKKKNIL
ncbi:hypothetical protein BGZ47_004954 [Haplosporangium gracile]|nr:hypothetical protein BGZ47_004954 [Haplosporangium gracile]